MHVYADIAKKYGKVDPSNQSAVRNFFRKTLPKKSASVREEIFNELLARDGEPNPGELTAFDVNHVASIVRPQMRARQVIAVKPGITVIKKHSKTSSFVGRTRVVGRSSVTGTFKKLKGPVLMRSSDGTWYEITEYKGNTGLQSGLRPLTQEVDIAEVFKNATLFKSASS